MFESAVPALEEFVTVIGLDPGRLPEWEGFQKVSIELYSLPAQQALQFEFRHCTRLVEAFDGCFTCRFALHPDDLDEGEAAGVVLNVKPHTSEAEVQAFHKRIQEVDSVEFSFKLEKKDMLARAGICAEHTNFYLYLFPTALTRFLRGETLAGQPSNAHASLRMFEENLWHGRPVEMDEKAVILVLDHDIQLQGEEFALIGGTHLDGWRQIPPSVTPISETNKIYETCRANVFWDNPWVTRLTPPKLKINDGKWQAGDPMVAALRAQLFNLIVLFTASRVAGNENDWTATYSSSLGTGDVLLYSPAQQGLEPDVVGNVNLFYDIFAWVYFSKWAHDRIAFVQSAVAEELMHSPREEAGRVLLERAKMLKTSVDNRWDNFVREKLQAYSKEEEALEDAVMEIIDTFSERVSSMGKSVSDAMLAAIAALLGSFVAAGFGTDSFNPFIFRVGMLVYSAYVLFFPFLYNMRAQWVQYRMLRDGILGRMDRLRGKLSEKRMEAIAGGRFEQSDRNFLFWFRATAGIYVLVVLVGIAAAFVVPGLIGG